MSTDSETKSIAARAMTSASAPNENILGPFTRREILRLAGLGGLGLTAPNLFTGCSNSDTPGARPPSYATTILTGRKAIQNALAAADGPSAVTVALVDPQRIL